MHVRDELKNCALEYGADIVGFCELPSPPVKELPELKYALSIGVKLSDAVLKTVESAPSFVYFQHYRAANALLDSITFRLSRELEKRGFSALPIAASQSLGKNNPYCGILPHKTAAVLSGLGFVGKSGLFLSEEFGSKVRLATILTDMPCKAKSPSLKTDAGIVRRVCGLVPRAQFSEKSRRRTENETSTRKNALGI